MSQAYTSSPQVLSYTFIHQQNCYSALDNTQFRYNTRYSLLSSFKLHKARIFYLLDDCVFYNNNTA